jgi:hypothetical protein
MPSTHHTVTIQLAMNNNISDFQAPKVLNYRGLHLANWLDLSELELVYFLKLMSLTVPPSGDIPIRDGLCFLACGLTAEMSTNGPELGCQFWSLYLQEGELLRNVGLWCANIHMNKEPFKLKSQHLAIDAEHKDAIRKGMISHILMAKLKFAGVGEDQEQV